MGSQLTQSGWESQSGKTSLDSLVQLQPPVEPPCCTMTELHRLLRSTPVQTVSRTTRASSAVATQRAGSYGAGRLLRCHAKEAEKHINVVVVPYVRNELRFKAPQASAPNFIALEEAAPHEVASITGSNPTSFACLVYTSLHELWFQ